MTGSGLIIFILALALPLFGVDVDQGSITQFVNATAQVIGFIMMVIGQVRRPDLKFGVIRR